MLKEIKGDLYDIADRLKEIDPSYTIVYNTILARYEVHSDKNVHDTLCVVSSFRHLDSRLLEVVRRTRRERSRELLEEMERGNGRLERAAAAAAAEKGGELLGEIVRYAKGGDLTFAQTEEVKKGCLGQ